MLSQASVPVYAQSLQIGAVVGESRQAVTARAAGEDRTDRNSITRGHSVNGRTHLDDVAYELVPEDDPERGRVPRWVAEDVDVRPAHAARHDPDQNVVIGQQPRSGPVLDRQNAHFLEDGSSHRRRHSSPGSFRWRRCRDHRLLHAR